MSKVTRKHYKQPLVVHFVCHKDDKSTAMPLIDVLYAAFSRDVAYPCSHQLNIPMFVWEDERFEQGISSGKLGAKTVIFAFTSAKSSIDNNWMSSLNRLNKRRDKIFIIPIALNIGGVSIPRGVGLNNVISYFKFSDEGNTRLILAAAQAICQHCYCPRDRQKQIVPLTVFLSHTKSDNVGYGVVRKLSSTIVLETSLRKFIDIRDIQAGEAFDIRILKSVRNSVFLAIVTDNYATRRWCQLEVIEAKKAGVPILVMNCVTKAEDRILPALTNVPCIRPVLNADLNDNIVSSVECLRTIKALMIESLRCYYLNDRLKALRRIGCFPSSCTVLARPPEANILVSNVKSVAYPEPELLREEMEFYFGNRVKLIVPNGDDGKNELKGMKVGISISNPENYLLSDKGVRLGSLMCLSQDIAQSVLKRGAKILYGGDLRPSDEDGFTAFILDEAKIVSNREGRSRKYVRNFLAWPIYVKQEDSKVAFQARYANLVDWVNVAPPPDLNRISGFDKNVRIKRDTPEHVYCIARSLTAMRIKAIKESSCRICAGGKLTNYSGTMPGVIDEILLAIEKGLPLYLLGGFGGATSFAVSCVLKKTVPEELTCQWQEKHSIGYSDLVSYAQHTRHPIDYAKMKLLKEITVEELATPAGLSVQEDRNLMTCPYTDECVMLVNKGLCRVGRSGCHV